MEKIRERIPPTIRIRDKVFTKRIFSLIVLETCAFARFDDDILSP